MSILSLPNELLIQIVESLTNPSNIYALALSSRRLAAVAIPTLYKLAPDDKDGLTALQWAITRRSSFRSGVSFDWKLIYFHGVPDPRKVTLLSAFAPVGTAVGGYEGLVRILLAQKVDVDYCNTYLPWDHSLMDHTTYLRSNPAVHLAVMFNQVAILRILLNHGAGVNVKNLAGDVALEWTLKHNMEEATLVLLEYGADVSANCGRVAGQMALHIAAQYSSPALVTMILDRGARAAINKQDKCGQSALHSAVHALATSVYKEDSERISVISLLLANGADVFTRDHRGRTPLHYAAEGSANKVVQILWENGADVDAQDFQGRTPLLKAVLLLREAAITTLLRVGADILAMGLDNDTIIDTVVEEFGSDTDCDRRDGAKTLRLLLANTEQVEKYVRYEPSGGKVMYWAVKADCEDLVSLLLDGGVDISAQQTGKQRLSNSPIEGTALHWAVMWGSEKVIRLLLSRGADTTVKANGDLGTAFQWARTSKIPEIVNLFPGIQSNGSRIASHNFNPAFEHKLVDSRTNTRVCNKAPERTPGSVRNSLSSYQARFRRFLHI